MLRLLEDLDEPERLHELRDPALVSRVLALTLKDAIGTQDVALVLTRMFGNPAAREEAWAFLKKRWRGSGRKKHKEAPI